MKARANQFENYIQTGFDAIREKTGAYLLWVNPPVVPCGIRGRMPVFAMSGSAPFDLGGWTNEKFAQPRAIGVELKETRDQKVSLPIIGPERQGSGLQYHQLEALSALHRDGHISGLLWCNGGIIGYLSGEALAAAHYDFEVSLEVQKMGKKLTQGARSIRWDKFKIVQGDDPEDWYVEGFHVSK